MKSILYIAVQAVSALSRHADAPGTVVVNDIRKTSVILGKHGLRKVDLPAQAVAQGQLRGHPKRVLSIKE